MTSLHPGMTLSSRWTLGEKVGEGACAEVFEALSNKIEGNFVIKCIRLPVGKGKNAQTQTRLANTLHYEHMLYKGVLLGYKYAPLLPYQAYGEDLGYRYLVMERLSMNLKDFAENVRTTPTPNVIASIGLQILDALQILHDKGYIFVDVKPDNFMIRKSGNSSSKSIIEFSDGDEIIVVDYGIAQKYIQYNGGKHVDQAMGGTVVGTPTFASLAVHQGSNPSRRDDLEAMGLVLLSLRKKGLMPWSTAKSDAECRGLKEACDVSALSEDWGCPELGELIVATRQLAFEERPDYRALTLMLQRMRDRPASSGSTGASRKKGSKSPSTGRTGSAVGASKLVDDSAASDDATVVASSSSGVGRKRTLRDRKAQKEPPPLDFDVVDLVEESKSPDVTTSNSMCTPVREAWKSGKEAVKSTLIYVDSHKPTRGRGKKGVAAAVPAVILESPPSPSPSPARRPNTRRRTSSSPTGSRDSADKENRTGQSMVLYVVEGPYKGLVTPVEAQGTIGREDVGCTLALPNDPYISELHIEYFVHPGNNKQLTIRDVESTNGTIVKGVKILTNEWTDIEIGDEVQIGQTKFQLGTRVVRDFHNTESTPTKERGSTLPFRDTKSSR